MEGREYLAEHPDRVAWIMGSSRSGSSWLLRMLGELPEVVGVDDPHLGHHLGVWRPLPIAWAVGKGRPQLTTLQEIKRHHDQYFFSDRHRETWLPALRDLVRARFAAELDEQSATAGNAPRLLVKEPGCHAAGEIFDLFPDSRLIFLLRDGRDVVDSWMDAHQEGSWAIEEGAFEVAAHGRQALVEWLASVWVYRTRAVAGAFAERPPARRVLARYEDLLEHPSTELERICAALGLDVSVDELDALAARHAFANLDRGDRGRLKRNRTAEPGGWRSNLRPEERRAMCEILGPELERLGYPSEPAIAA
ncbi:MAG: sulfotransferase family protein [Solirubrobacterales bacterium]